MSARVTPNQEFQKPPNSLAQITAIFLFFCIPVKVQVRENKMSGVTMDEKTANNYLLVTNGKELKMSPTAGNGTPSAQRFDMKPCVLSRESYASDISLTVNVNKVNMWRIGVVTGSAKRHGFTMMHPRNFYWVIEWKGRELVALDDKEKIIQTDFVQKLTIRLDFSNRKLTFDSEKKVDVYTFDNMYFSESLYILFSTTDENNPLTIN